MELPGCTAERALAGFTDVLAAALAGGSALGLVAGFAVAGGAVHLASGKPAAATGPAGSAAGADAALAALVRPAAATPADPIFMFINVSYSAQNPDGSLGKTETLCLTSRRSGPASRERQRRESGRGARLGDRDVGGDDG